MGAAAMMHSASGLVSTETKGRGPAACGHGTEFVAPQNGLKQSPQMAFGMNATPSAALIFSVSPFFFKRCCKGVLQLTQAAFLVVMAMDFGTSSAEGPTAVTICFWDCEFFLMRCIARWQEMRRACHGAATLGLRMPLRWSRRNCGVNSRDPTPITREKRAPGTPRRAARILHERSKQHGHASAWVFYIVLGGGCLGLCSSTSHPPVACTILCSLLFFFCCFSILLRCPVVIGTPATGDVRFL